MIQIESFARFIGTWQQPSKANSDNNHISSSLSDDRVHHVPICRSSHGTAIDYLIGSNLKLFESMYKTLRLRGHFHW